MRPDEVLFARVGPVGREIPVARFQDRTFDLTPLVAGDMAEVRSLDLNRLIAVVEAGQALEFDGEVSWDGFSPGLRVGAPIPRPAAVLCIGMNYAAHAREAGSAPPDLPVLFLKHPNTIVGPFDDIRIPRGSAQTDWEVELGVVIGARARYLASAEEAQQYIAGYVVSNDVSERAFQLEHSGGQWSKGKCAESFNPLGPFLVPSRYVDDPQALAIKSWVNDQPRQDSNTTDMIFGVKYLVWHLSQYMVLEPGDLINTGTPEGVALSGRFCFLGAGDVVTSEIDRVGRQRQHVRAWAA